jgi:hypothetical protein
VPQNNAAPPPSAATTTLDAVLPVRASGTSPTRPHTADPRSCIPHACGSALEAVLQIQSRIPTGAVDGMLDTLMHRHMHRAWPCSPSTDASASLSASVPSGDICADSDTEVSSCTGGRQQARMQAATTRVVVPSGPSSGRLCVANLQNPSPARYVVRPSQSAVAVAAPTRLLAGSEVADQKLQWMGGNLEHHGVLGTRGLHDQHKVCPELACID